MYFSISIEIYVCARLFMFNEALIQDIHCFFFPTSFKYNINKKIIVYIPNWELLKESRMFISF